MDPDHLSRLGVGQEGLAVHLDLADQVRRLEDLDGVVRLGDARPPPTTEQVIQWRRVDELTELLGHQTRHRLRSGQERGDVWHVR